MKVFFTRQAKQTVIGLASFIAAEIKMPLTGIRYTARMIDFGLNLGKLPLIHPVCRFGKYAKHNYRCAVFDSKWIFVYSITDKVVIRDIKNAATLKS